MSSAYLLVYHGSRDPRPQAAVEKLAEFVAQSKARKDKGFNNSSLVGVRSSQQVAALPVAVQSRLQPMVGTACLELSPVPLNQQIKEFGDRALAAGHNNVQVVPLFLLPGVHVMEDIPAEVTKAQQALGQRLKIELQPYLGTHAGLQKLLAAQMAAAKVDAWILLAHGSRRAGSQQPVEVLATEIGAVCAYWARSPQLEERVKELVSAGRRQIGIVPYFLFAGGITDAIALAVEQLKVQFPDVLLYLAEPLGASVELAELILDVME